MNLQPRKASPEERRALARTLDDTPESVISIHLLARGLAEAYVAGDPTRPDGVIVQGGSDPGELMSFGSDAAVLWELLRLVEGVVAGAVVEDDLAAIAFTHALSARHADVAVNTLKEWRGRGFATAAASLVAQRLQEAGQRPVWSSGEDNLASLRVAQKLGFTPITRRTYLIRD